MNNTLDKLSSIISLFDTLNDENRIKLESKFCEHIDEIDSICNKILSDIDEQDIISDLELTNKKQKILAQMLFPNYWIIMNRINEMNIHELNVLLKISTN